MPTSIHSLPEEMLTAVLGYVVDDVSTNQQKQLRLVSKVFASNYAVMTSLFKSIYLVADVTFVEKLQKVNLPVIVPFVQSVTFVPPLYNWNLDFDDFQKALQLGWTYKIGCYSRKWQKEAKLELSDDKDAVEKDRIRHTRRQAKKAFHKYAEISTQNQTLIEARSSSLVLVWARLLRSMPRCHTVGFKLVEHMVLDPKFMPDFPECVRESVPEWRRQGFIVSQPMDAICGLALEALARSRTPIHAISLKRTSSTGLATERGLRHPLLHLCDLKDVELDMWRDKKAAQEAREESSEQLVADAIYLLGQCSAIIETLDCHGHDVLFWPETKFETPSLRTLILGISDVPCAFLVSLITSSKKLNKISLENVALVQADNPHRSWKDVFKALRNHENAMNLHMSLFLYDSEVWLDFEKPSAAEIEAKHAQHQKYVFEDADDDDWDRSVKLYLTKQGEWDGELEDVFAWH